MVESVLYRYRFLYLFLLLGAVPVAYSILYPSLLEYWFKATASAPTEYIPLRHTGLIVGSGDNCPTYGVGVVPDFNDGGSVLYTPDEKKMCGCIFVDVDEDVQVLSRLNDDGTVSFLCGTDVITLRIQNDY